MSKKAITNNDKEPIMYYQYVCPYCSYTLKPIDEITLLCNHCNRFWFGRYIETGGQLLWSDDKIYGN